MPGETRIDGRKFADYVLGLAGGFPIAFRRGIQSGALACLPLMHSRTRQAAPASPGGPSQGGAVDSGALLRAWKAVPLDDGAMILNSTPYAAVVEGGRRPGSFPPRKPLVRWAQRRLGLSLEEAESASFAIARAIAKRGLKPRRILEGGIPEMVRIIEREVERSLDDMVAGR